MMCMVLFSACFFSFKKIISAKTRGRKIGVAGGGGAGRGSSSRETVGK